MVGVGVGLGLAGQSFCPCFDFPDDDDNRTSAAELDPVLLVSGIGGSILHSKRKKFGFDTRVWVRILLADLEFRKRIWSVYNPHTGYTESLNKDTEIVIPDDDYGLYAIDILDPSWFVKCIHLKEVYQFHDMIDMLVGCGYKKGTTLFGYGYDFRQSNRIGKLMEGLKVKLETAYKASGGRKVNIISHSMGGLLVTCFMSLHNDVFLKYVSKWICIACPFQGAPGCINDSLLTGLQFVEGFESYFFVSRWTMHQLLVECPSIYEMLANPKFNWKRLPEIQVWRKHSKDGENLVDLESYGPIESISLFEEALKHNEVPLFRFIGKRNSGKFSKHLFMSFGLSCYLFFLLLIPRGSNLACWFGIELYSGKKLYDTQSLCQSLLLQLSYDGKTVALPFNFSILRWAAETRQVFNNAKLPDGVCFYNIYGTSFDTPFDVRYGSKTSPVEDLSEICRTMPQYSYVDGDETVPAESAKADGFAAVERVAIAARHRELLRDNTVFRYIQKWLGVEQKMSKHSKTSRVADASSNKRVNV